METCEYVTWEEYENGTPENNEVVQKLVVSELVNLKNAISVATQLCQDGEGKPQPKDESEQPDTGPWIDVPNYKAKVVAIRTGADGKYRGTTLEALQDIPKVIKKGRVMILSNKNWEAELKRAQNGGFEVCLRIGDKKVQSIEVLS